MVKLVDTLDLDPSAYTRESSSLSICKIGPRPRVAIGAVIYLIFIYYNISALQDSNLQPLISKNNALSN